MDDFDPVEIRTSASTLDEYIAGMQKQKGTMEQSVSHPFDCFVITVGSSS